MTLPYDATSALLLQFSEWRDRDDFGRPDPSLPSHTQLVAEFLANRNATAKPAITTDPADPYRQVPVIFPTCVMSTFSNDPRDTP